MTEAFSEVRQKIDQWSADLGFQQVAITGVDPGIHAERLDAWLAAGFHGDMEYLSKHASLRRNPGDLLPGGLRLICVRMNNLSCGEEPLEVLENPSKAYIARYALGRDYHKMMRNRLARLAERISQQTPGYRFRALVDSAPVLERGACEQAGLGWIGKNTMLINSQAGSWFFLGEIVTDMPLPIDSGESTTHCGTCRQCLDICPTKAFTGPFELDARRCISYLTIESRGPIPLELRPLLGNRVFGCDDCQLVCPWNKFASYSKEDDFVPRHGLDCSSLVDLFNWTEQEFLERTAGSAIRRCGYLGWLRNLAVALGNGPAEPQSINALELRTDHDSELVREHVQWALTQLHKRTSQA